MESAHVGGDFLMALAFCFFFRHESGGLSGSRALMFCFWVQLRFFWAGLRGALVDNLGDAR
jgi:hypothetical protein